jgi:hypothetical protein
MSVRLHLSGMLASSGTTLQMWGTCLHSRRSAFPTRRRVPIPSSTSGIPSSPPAAKTRTLRASPTSDSSSATPRTSLLPAISTGTALTPSPSTDPQNNTSTSPTPSAPTTEDWEPPHSPSSSETPRQTLRRRLRRRRHLRGRPASREHGIRRLPQHPHTGIADNQFFFGDPGDRFVAGDWGIIDGLDTRAMFRPSSTTYYFRHTNTQGNATANSPGANPLGSPSRERSVSAQTPHHIVRAVHTEDVLPARGAPRLSGFSG